MKWQTFERMEQWRHWMSEKHLHLMIIGILLLDTVLLIALFEPIRWVRQRIENDIIAWRTYHTDLKNATRAWEEALQRLRNARADRQRLLSEQFLPEASGYTVIREFLEQAAKKSGIRHRDIAYENREINTLNLNELKIGIPVTGTYAQVRQYLERIEQSPYFLIIESVTWRATPRSNLIDVDIVLRTYFTSAREGARTS